MTRHYYIAAGFGKQINRGQNPLKTARWFLFFYRGHIKKNGKRHRSFEHMKPFLRCLTLCAAAPNALVPRAPLSVFATPRGMPPRQRPTRPAPKPSTPPAPVPRHPPAPGPHKPPRGRTAYCPAPRTTQGGGGGGRCAHHPHGHGS